MAVQQSSGGTAQQKQFVDTVGGFTGVGGENHIVISSFVPLKVTLTDTPRSGNTFLRHKLADLIITTGYAPVKCFQFYRLATVEIWLHDIDYGQTWENESQIWNIFMAPWKIDPYISSENFAQINARYIPGCVWKNMVAPSINGAQSAGFSHSSANNQMVSLRISDPPFEMETYNSDATLTTRKQMNNTFLPTYSNLGIDTTQWQTAIVSYYQISGDEPPPNPMFHLYMLKLTFEFKGLRCLLTTALDLYLPDEDEENKKSYINTTHDVARNTRKRTRTKEDSNALSSMGSHPAKSRPDRYTHELHNR